MLFRLLFLRLVKGVEKGVLGNCGLLLLPNKGEGLQDAAVAAAVAPS